jgi:gliding motility-associated-like protein
LKSPRPVTKTAEKKRIFSRFLSNHWEVQGVIIGIVKTALTCILLLFSLFGWSQTFPVTGQLASTAFPVCGSNTFKQTTVPIGVTTSLIVPSCGSGYADLNPFWYSFTCFKSGTLGFLITPNNLVDDYDWMLFDVTGHNVDDVYRNNSLVVTGNWSGTYGYTGAHNGGSNFIQCASFPADHTPTFSAMPKLIQGHQYLLLVSHYTDSQSGYSLAFGGGTAVINDPGIPSLQSATVGCNKKLITVVLSKKVRCSSLVPDGSDFTIAGNAFSVVGAAGSNCSNAFDMDTLTVSTGTPLTPGSYSLVMQNGTDGNSLLDDCGTQIAVGDKVDFTVIAPQPTPFDSLTTPTCAASVLHFIFSDPIQCSSIAADGSDFTVTGSSVIGVSAATGDCVNGLSKTINLTLTNPVVIGGNYQVTLKNGSDGNTIMNECGDQTSAGSSVSFNTKDTLSAAFSYDIGLGCVNDSIGLHYQIPVSATQWSWNIDSTFSSSLPDLTFITSVFGLRKVLHIVTNGFCSDTATQIVNLSNIMKAIMQSPNEVCPKNLITFSDSSIGNLISWSWNFGDGTGSLQQDPQAHLFPDTWEGKTYLVSLVVKNNLGCYDTVSKEVVKMQSCAIAVPNAFTPNGDGKNDFLYPLNAFSAINLEFLVYNRYGQLVFETRDWSRKWDGSINGVPQPTGPYVWTLRYTDASGRKYFLHGSSALIR